ncbi:MAG: EAL domain-containing protein, partial [Oscillospiraceae bacterium]
INITVKYGVFSIDNEKLSVGVMCDRALLAADGIKGHYGEFFAYYDDSIRQRLLKEQFINDNMEAALEAKQFEVYVQPKYSLRSDKIAGAEALVRWLHPQRGLMSPVEFIPLFEKNGFITRLDYFVWDKTCGLIRKWLDMGLEVVPISVNVSRADIYNPDLLENISGLLEKYNLEPARLHLEITETAYTENPKQIIESVKKLKRYGFIIEMDDFGTGYSSLNMLSELPIDVLKLDMKFIQNESKKDCSRNILSFIVSLAKWMNILVVAEGVETEEQVHHLKDMECNYVQGYYYARPMPWEEFQEVLGQGNVDCDDMQESVYTATMEVSITENPQNKKIMLVVDDIELHRTILKQAFSHEFTVAEANNGYTAMKFIEEHLSEIQVVLLDLVMPIMDGFQLLEKMKKDSKFEDIPIIITSQSGENSEERALSLGADDFISKPYNIKIIKNHVQRTIAYAKMKIRNRENAERLKVSTMEIYHDYLTGLLNRCGFDKALEVLQKEESEGLYALYVADLDDFKKYNKEHGHLMADECLKKFAMFLREILRSNDIVARIGDDEFVIILKNIPSEEMAEKRGETICNGWNGNCSGSCSVGFTVFHKESGCDIQKIINQANEALYSVKQNGKGKCKRF